jgi:hypothetical protein
MMSFDSVAGATAGLELPAAQVVPFGIGSRVFDMILAIPPVVLLAEQASPASMPMFIYMNDCGSQKAITELLKGI